MKSPHNGYEPPDAQGLATSPGFSGTTVSALSTSDGRKPRATKCSDYLLRYAPAGQKTDLLSGPVTVTSPEHTAKVLMSDPSLSEMHRGVPLQFPHLIPPTGQSHMSGRYVQ